MGLEKKKKKITIRKFTVVLALSSYVSEDTIFLTVMMTKVCEHNQCPHGPVGQEFKGDGNRYQSPYFTPRRGKLGSPWANSIKQKAWKKMMLTRACLHPMKGREGPFLELIECRKPRTHSGLRELVGYALHDVLFENGSLSVVRVTSQWWSVTAATKNNSTNIKHADSVKWYSGLYRPNSKSYRTEEPLPLHLLHVWLHN